MLNETFYVIFKHHVCDASNLRYFNTFVNFFIWIECVKENMASPQQLLLSTTQPKSCSHFRIFKFPTRIFAWWWWGQRTEERVSQNSCRKKKFEKFVEKVCYDAWWHQKEEEEERVIRRRPKYYLLGLLAVDTVFENHPKCRLWIFQFGPFQPIFVPLKLTCRFARHVECDFWGDFPPLWSSLSEAAMHSYTLRGQCVDVNRAADPFGILLSFNILCRAYTYYTDFVLQSNTT